MVRLGSLIVLCLLPAAPVRAWLQSDAHSAGLRVLVQGEPAAARAMVEAFRRTMPGGGALLQLVGSRSDPHDIVLIVTLAEGSARCPNQQDFNRVSLFYGSLAATSSDANLLFTVAQSGDTAMLVVDALAREALKRLSAPTAQRPDSVGQVGGLPQTSGSHGVVKPQGPPFEPGVYYESNGRWARLVETVASAFETRGKGLTLLSWGTSATRVSRVYPGARANVQVSERVPMFFVRGFAVTQNDIAIVRLSSRKGRREVEIGSVNVFKSSDGYRDADKRRVRIDALSGELIKIIPASALEPGEYVLSFFSGGLEGVYEFSVSPTSR